MKKSAAVILAALTLSACGADQELIQKSMNNIKDEMLGIQSTMGDMQVKMQELDKNIRTNSENINKNSEGISQLREEMTVMNTDIIDLKDRVGAIEKGKTTPAASDMPLPAADSGAVMAAPAHQAEKTTSSSSKTTCRTNSACIHMPMSSTETGNTPKAKPNSMSF